MKKGITLISLVITIIVLLIILSTVVISTVTITNNSKKATFAKDLKTIEEAVISEYSTNGVLPTTTLTYSLEEMKTISEKPEKIAAELTENKDDAITTEFYQVDLNKIGIKNSSRGNGSGQNDMYFVSSENLNIYYLRGLNVSSNTYFSITSALIKGSKIEKKANEGTEGSDVVLANGIKLSKNKKIWTNDLAVTVQLKLEGTETAGFSIAGGTPIPLTTGITKISLNSSTLTGTALNTFNDAEIANKTIVITKTIPGSASVIATIDIKNLDLQAPTPGGNSPKLVATSTKNTLTFSGMTDTGGSGIKEIRYEYIKKLNSSNIYENAYIPQPTIDSEYLKSSGKKTDSTSVVCLPKHITKIAATWIDKAGNVGATIEYNVNSYVTDGLILWIDGTSFKNSLQTNWLDGSGNGNRVTPLNFGYIESSGSDGSGGVVFDGTKDYATVPSANFLGRIGNSYTISVWIKDDATTETLTTTFHRILSFANGTTNLQLGLGTRTTNGDRMFYIQESGTNGLVKQTTSGNVSLGWHHVLATSNGAGTWNMYLDGVLSNGGSTVEAGPNVYNTNTGLMYVGQRGDSTCYLNGTVKNILMYNRVLTTYEIAQNYAKEEAGNLVLPETSKNSFDDYVKDGMVSLLDGFDFENSPQTTTWIDKSGNGNDAIPYNFGYTISSGSGGDGSIVFDGNNDYFVAKNPIKGLNTFTIIFWFKQNSPNPWSDVFTFNTGVDTNAGRIEYVGSDTYRWYGNDTPIISGAILFTHTGTFYDYIVLKCDGINVYCYKNGVITYNAVKESSNMPTSDNINIGCRIFTSMWKGSIRKFQVYNRALTDYEIKQNYANDLKRFGI